MIANTDIERGAITATKLSRNLRLPLANITAGESGQVLIGQANGDLAYKPVTGAMTIDSDGLTEVVVTTDSVSEGTTNLYYTDEKVDARIRALRTGDSQLATTTESGFMPKADKVKVDATPSPSSAVRKFSVEFSWGTDKAKVSYPDGTAGQKAKISHNLRTDFVICSVLDVDGSLLKGANTQLDLNFDDEVLLVKNSINEITLAFDHEPDAGETYLVTIIG